MKKSLMFLLGSFLLFGLDSYQPTFNSFENKPYLIDRYLYDVNKDGIKDIVVGIYDFNGNDISDCAAGYKIVKINSRGVFHNPKARVISIDKNEDGQAELIMWDKNEDGKLETKIKNKKAKKTPGVSI